MKGRERNGDDEVVKDARYWWASNGRMAVHCQQVSGGHGKKFAVETFKTA